MHIKFLARGTGSARAAADYLLGVRDAAGQLRAGVEVFRGNPHQAAAVADALAFEHKYTSGVIAWAPDDTPTDAQIEAVLDEFERTAWAGLEPDRYAWAAVVHRERGGGAHVHVLAARCDLETGRSLNIAPPGWQKTFGPLRDAFNAEHGWSRPDDPARARVQQPGHRAYLESAQLRAGLALEPAPRELIRDYLLQRVENGTVQNRADVVAALQEAGLEVSRQGKDYLTALDPTTGDRWRLKGELYAHDFKRERLDRAVAETAGDRTPGDRGIDDERARAARRELAARCEERAAYHRARYGGCDRADARPPAQGLAPAPGRRPEPLLGICGGNWATMHWLSARIQARIETAAALDLDIEQARQTLAQLETDTWGIALREIAGERFVVLPAGALAYPPRRVDTRPAVKLSNE